MAIYDMFDSSKKIVMHQRDFLEEIQKNTDEERMETEIKGEKRDRFFSSAVVRLFFILLLIADLLWSFYSLFSCVLYGILNLLTLFKVSFFQEKAHTAYLSFKRSLICAVSLVVALFSPALGIMIACTYFLMYDKSGIEEIVPAPLRQQFEEFISQSKSENSM